MDLNRFTNKAQQAVLAAQSSAVEYNHTEITPEHLLLALLRQAGGVVPEVVSKIGARPEVLIGELEGTLQSRPKVYGGDAQPSLSRPPPTR